MKLQYEPNGQHHKVVIKGAFYGDKTFPSLNNLLAEYGRRPQIGNAMKQKFQEICCWQVRSQLRGLKIEKPVILHYRYFEPNRGQKRDYPNIHSFFSKCFCDSIIAKNRGAGVIEDDNPKYLLNETHDFFYTDGEPFIEVYIEEVSDSES